MDEPESFLEYYESHKDILDRCIPKEVLKRLLEKNKNEFIRGDAWEPPSRQIDKECPF